MDEIVPDALLRILGGTAAEALSLLQGEPLAFDFTAQPPGPPPGLRMLLLPPGSGKQEPLGKQIINNVIQEGRGFPCFLFNPWGQ